MQYSSEEASVCKIDGDIEKWTSPYGMMHEDVGIWSYSGDNGYSKSGDSAHCTPKSCTVIKDAETFQSQYI
jgi:hypothetical protein